MKLLLEQLKYNQWAVSQYVKVVSQLDLNQLMHGMKSSFSSIHETLGHMLWVEELWYERWKGHSFMRSFAVGDYPTLDFINRNFKDIHEKQIQLLESFKPGEENRLISYVNFQGETWQYSFAQMLQHLMFHSAYHRGQLATMLRQLGKVPPKTDYLVFIDEQSLAGP